LEMNCTELRRGLEDEGVDSRAPKIMGS
jgi:hypothetical protein